MNRISSKAKYFLLFKAIAAVSLAYLAVAASSPAQDVPPKEGAVATAAGREWVLTPECRQEGDILTVVVPEGAAPGQHGAWTTVNLAPFAEDGFEASVQVRGENVSVPPERYNGVKFVLHWRNAVTGADEWPGAWLPTGTFDWQTAFIGCGKTSNVEGGKADLLLGLQNSSGTVVFDLSTLRFVKPVPHWPVTNQNHRCEYNAPVGVTSDKRRVTNEGGSSLVTRHSSLVTAAQRRPPLRGVMSPGGNMTEDDFKTLHEWGATLLRFQMVRDWHAVNGNQDLDEYDRWLESRLDHFDTVVLPLAQKYGIMVVLDLHVPPGGRDAGMEANMFYDERIAGHFVELWRRIAKRFKGREGIYGYDLINEPCQRRETPAGCDWWSLQRRAAEAIRAEDPLTPIIVESNQWDSPGSFRYLSPLTLTNILYEVHMYGPDDFTHQRVLGTRPWTVPYPNAEKGWNRESLAEMLRPVREFQHKHGSRIYVGEFSAVCWAPGAENWLRDCISVFEENGWDWTYHAFREWAGWSVEHEGEDDASLRTSEDNPRKRALIEGLLMRSKFANTGEGGNEEAP